MNNNDREWRKVDDFAPLVDFEKTPEVTGKLIDVRKVEKYNNYVYEVETEAGRLAFFGSVVLNRKLSGLALGNEIRVVYKGMRKFRNRMVKDFDVFYR